MKLLHRSIFAWLVFHLGLASLCAQPILLQPQGRAATTGSQISNVRVGKPSADGTEVTLTLDYSYDGLQGQRVRITPVITDKAKPEVSHWFGAETKTVGIASKGTISIKVKFFNDEPGVPPEITTDRIHVIMFNDKGTSVVNEYPILKTIKWGNPNVKPVPPPQPNPVTTIEASAAQLTAHAKALQDEADAKAKEEATAEEKLADEERRVSEEKNKADQAAADKAKADQAAADKAKADQAAADKAKTDQAAADKAKADQAAADKAKADQAAADKAKADQAAADKAKADQAAADKAKADQAAADKAKADQAAADKAKADQAAADKAKADQAAADKAKADQAAADKAKADQAAADKAKADQAAADKAKADQAAADKAKADQAAADKAKADQAAADKAKTDQAAADKAKADQAAADKAKADLTQLQLKLEKAKADAADAKAQADAATKAAASRPAPSSATASFAITPNLHTKVTGMDIVNRSLDRSEMTIRVDYNYVPADGLGKMGVDLASAEDPSASKYFASEPVEVGKSSHPLVLIPVKFNPPAGQNSSCPTDKVWVYLAGPNGGKSYISSGTMLLMWHAPASSSAAAPVASAHTSLQLDDFKQDDAFSGHVIVRYDLASDSGKIHLRVYDSTKPETAGWFVSEDAPIKSGPGLQPVKIAVSPAAAGPDLFNADTIEITILDNDGKVVSTSKSQRTMLWAKPK